MAIRDLKDEKRQINISMDLITRIETRVAQSDEFSTIEKYVEYILSRVLDIIEKQFPDDKKGVGNHDSSLKADEEEKIKKRLENLGYM